MSILILNPKIYYSVNIKDLHIQTPHLLIGNNVVVG